ncbi:olfactory receptor 5AP2-like [Paroedura picta]|uniref:olfactory receptor 5AP2-like n=1 Tax=Paroedura picta TaxID=143630 RepID=UPI00405729B4
MVWEKLTGSNQKRQISIEVTVLIAHISPIMFELAQDHNKTAEKQTNKPRGSTTFPAIEVSNHRHQMMEMLSHSSVLHTENYTLDALFKRAKIYNACTKSIISDIEWLFHKLLYFQQQINNRTNQTIITNFILMGFSGRPELQVLLFLSFLTIYMLTVTGNIIIIVLVVTDLHLHTPMYFFLGNLSCLEICYTSTILPRLLFSLFAGDRTISVHGCIVQYFFFGSLASTECYLLAIMSYDRYLAICRPLRYTDLMNGRTCFWFLAISWMSGLLNIGIITSLLFDLLFCGPNEIEHFFCDIAPLFKLSCSSTHLVELVNFIFASLDTVPPFLLTLISYIYIIINILQMKSKVSRQKAFSTCSSHLIVVTLFYGSLICVYLLPETDTLKELHKTFSLFYTVFTPMLNPLIYSLRNREVKAALSRTANKIVAVVNSFSL